VTSLRVLIPLGLGLAAGLLNFIALRSATAPLYVVVVRDNVKVGTELTDRMLDRLSVRADRELVKSAVPYEERGLVVGRRVNRPMQAGEIVFFSDVRIYGGEEIRDNLRPGEVSLTMIAKHSRIAPGLRIGDEVSIVVAERPGTASAGAIVSRVVGPFRLVGFGEHADPYLGGPGRLEPVRKVVVAAPVGRGGLLDSHANALERAAQSGDDGILAVEFYRLGKN
jgi:hypothetical protein